MLRSLEHDEAFGDGRQRLNLRIGARQMGAQRAAFGRLGVDQKRNGVRLQAVGPGGDKQPERMLADQRVLNREPALHEVRRLIHGRAPGAAYDTRFTRPQPFSADQIPRSSRKRSIGADELMARMR